MKKIKAKFLWNKEVGLATCILKYKNNTYIGNAYCHPEDMDYISETTGCYIAEVRALDQLYSYLIKELKTEHRILNNIIKNVDSSAQRKHDATYWKIKKRMKAIDEKIQYYSSIQFENGITLNEYMTNKEKLHNKLRKGKKD